MKKMEISGNKNELNQNARGNHMTSSFNNETKQQKSLNFIEKENKCTTVNKGINAKSNVMKKSIDKKKGRAITSKEIKICVACTNEPSCQSLSNFAVKYQEIINRKG